MTSDKRPFLDWASSPAVRDWKDASKYPTTERTTGEQWAWEFLRRNPKYQEEFAETDKSSNAALHALARRWGLLSEPPDPDGKVATAERLVDTGSGIRSVRELAQPEFEGNHIEWLSLATAITTRPVPKGMLLWEPRCPSEVAIVFDLARPLEIQIKRAKSQLTLLKAEPFFNARVRESRAGRASKLRKSGGGKTDLYSVYLRLLDAESSGAKTSQMAAVLFQDDDIEPGRRKVNRLLKRAHYLRDEGYRNIPGSLPDPSGVEARRPTEVFRVT
jgi:hypothetical protein